MAKNQDEPTLSDAEEAFEAGDVETALDILDGLLPENEAEAPVEVLYLLAECLLELQEPEEAERYAELGLAQSPDEPALLHTLGLALFEQNRLDSARARFEAAVAGEPELAEALFFLGILAERGGDRAGAEALWARAVDADPENLAMPVAWTEEQVRAALVEVLDEAPEPLATWWRSLVIAVQPLPDDSQLGSAEDPISPLAHCLFEGGERSEPEGDEPEGWFAAVPDRVVFYSSNLGKSAQDTYELGREVMEAMIWETIDFLGFEEEHLEALGISAVGDEDEEESDA